MVALRLGVDLLGQDYGYVRLGAGDQYDIVNH